MDINEHTQPHKLERYSFLWSEARLLIAAVALFLGGRPPLLVFNPVSSLYVPLNGLLQLCWIVSGLASGYLLYRWSKNNKMVFGGKNQKDMVAFFVSVVSGINLGLTGLLGNNLGMRILYGKVIFAVVGVIYLWAAWHLYNKWKSHGEKVF